MWGVRRCKVCLVGCERLDSERGFKEKLYL